MSKPSRFPHTLLLILALVFGAQLLCYALPSGSYKTEAPPSAGKPYPEQRAVPSLRERLDATMRSRGVSDAQLAELMQVSANTVRNWRLGPTPPEPAPERWTGTHIEAGAGTLLEAWLVEQRPPSQAQIDAWKASLADEKQLLVPGSYERSATKPEIHPLQTLLAVPQGMVKAADIIFFVFLIGGMLGVLRATGALEALISASIQRFGKGHRVLVVGTTTLFAIASGMMGTAEEYVPFIALLVTLSLGMNLDAMVGIAIVFVGYAVGYGCAPLNPFTVVVAQEVADLPPSSGASYRWILLFLGLLIGVHHLLRYCRRIIKDPSQSLVADIDYSGKFELPPDMHLDSRRKLVLFSLAGVMGLFVWGVSAQGWYFSELSALFVGHALLIPLLAGMSYNHAAQKFCEGAAELTTTALLIGFARAIEVNLVQGEIIHTVVHSISSTLSGLPDYLAAVGMLVVQSLCNFFIPSGSGQAYVTMPIMAPLADDLGIQRQVAVLAYQFGDGFTNVLTPTNAAMMGMLAIARVPYDRWLRFAIPLMIKLYLMAALALMVAVWIGYS